MNALPGGIRPRKRLDQYFIVNPGILRVEVSLAELDGKDTVLEIGAGNGLLTGMIAERAGRVVAVEKDPRLIENLKRTLPGNVEVIHADALEMEFPAFNKAMGNLPYSISTPLLFKLLDHDFEIGVLGVQYEFAKRMVARPGSREYSRLSVMTSLRTRRAFMSIKIPRGAFRPIPRVDSAVVKLVPGAGKGPDGFLAEIVRILFCHKRKTLRNAVRDSEAEFEGLVGAGPDRMLDRVEAEWDTRVFKMTPEEVMAFSRSVSEAFPGASARRRPADERV
jgi:16S rRNA (adenine1518-N6/adenine1519-N6)-dimethyltransferase